MEEYAIQWLVWEGKQRNIKIIYAAKQQEAILQDVKLMVTTLKPNGSEFHGCPTCFKYGRNDSHAGRSLTDFKHSV